MQFSALLLLGEELGNLHHPIQLVTFLYFTLFLHKGQCYQLADEKLIEHP